MTTVLITGVNRGIGRALAQGYLARGDTVIGTARKPEAASDIKGLDVIALDVMDRASFTRAQAQLTGRAIDVLIANAGANNQARGGLADPLNTPESWADMLAVSVTGVFLTVAALADNVAKARGKIAVISSQMGSSTRSGAGSYGYRASKAAASNLVVNMALELAPRGVAIASYHPGWVKTDMGGTAATLTTDESARHLMALFDKLSLATTGGFFDYDGKVMPF
jgi:NAD(P)-dependent dehydrogenase (short-subunit alcohol dehydrogenase family)